MTLEEEAKRCFQWRWALICSSFVPTSMNLNWNGRPILYASTRATLMSCTTICQMWVLWNTYIRNSSLFGTEFQKQQKCLIWSDLYHKAFLGDFLTLCFFCVNCRSQICHSVPFNWKALGSKMPFCHPVALMLWIIWEVFAKAQIPQILLRATSATLQTWQKKVFSRTSPPLISILNSESTTAQKLINILVLPLLIQQKPRNM